MWRECRLHQIDKALLELAAENLRASAKGDAGRHSPNGYSQHHSGTGYCYEGLALALTVSQGYSAGARLYKSQKGKANYPQAHTKSGVYCCRTDVSFNAVFVFAVLSFLTWFVAKYHTALWRRNWRGM